MRQLFQHRSAAAPTRAGRPDLPRNHRLPLAYRLAGRDAAESEARGEFARAPRLALLEAVLLAADEPLSARRLAQVAGLADAAEARRMLAQLQELYDREGSSFGIEELAGGYQLLTRPEYYPWLARLRRSGGDLKLGPAARETLAIVAYRQPITRADIEAVRGVQCSDVLGQLMEKGLVRIAGRDDSLGRPVLYGTTRRFLQLFGFRSLRDLPRSAEFRRPGPKRPKPGPEGES